MVKDYIICVFYLVHRKKDLMIPYPDIYLLWLIVL